GVREHRRAARAQAELEAQAPRSASPDAHAACVHPAQWVPGAERRAVARGVGSALRAEDDVVVVEIPVARAARNRAAEAVAGEHAPLAADALLAPAPGEDRVIEPRAPRIEPT